MSSPIESLRAQFGAELASAATDADLKVLRDQYLGRKGGAVAALMKAVASAPADERPALGRLANELKQEIELAAEATGSSEAEVMRKALEAAMRQCLPPKPRMPLFAKGKFPRDLAEKVDEYLKGFGE